MRTILNFMPVLLVVAFAVFLSFVCANVALIGVAFGSILLTAPALFCAAVSRALLRLHSFKTTKGGLDHDYKKLRNSFS
jgi:hypothetical protein